MSTHPILLAHGIARFDFLRQHFAEKLGVADIVTDRTHYFRNIKSHLAAHGFTVHATSVDFAGSVERRADELRAEVDRLHPAGKVHIIGHSMGGLDARRMIVNGGMAGRVASLTTVGTPHAGSSFADWGREHRADVAVRALDGLIDLNGFLDLTLEACGKFNREAEAAEAANEVFYQTYASHDERGRVFRPLQPAWDKISDAEGDNDGLVSLKSQQWTSELRDAATGRTKPVAQHTFPVSADHLNQVGWWEPNLLGGKAQVSLLRRPLAFIKNLLNERREYENQIKSVYLGIAEDLRRRFPA